MAAASALDWMNWLSIVALGIAVVALVASFVIPGPALVGSQGPQGLQGPQGPQGPQGNPGAQGPPGISEYQIVSVTVVESAMAFDVVAQCPSGKKVLGGGHEILPAALSTVLQSAPTVAGDGWHVRGSIEAAGTFEITAYAICATVM